MFLLLLAVFFAACSSDEVQTNVVTSPDKELSDGELTSVIDALYPQKDIVDDQMIVAELEHYVALDSNVKNISLNTRAAGPIVMSKDALVLFDSITALKPENYSTSQEYYDAIRSMIEVNKNTLSMDDYIAFDSSIDVAEKITDKYLLEKANANNAITRAGKKGKHRPESKQSWWKAWGKCTASITAGAIGGGISGGIAGSALPGLGTTAGAILGAIGGGLQGAVNAC